MRTIKPIFKIQPIQQDTVELVPLCVIPGMINKSLLAGQTDLSKITIEKETSIFPTTDCVFKLTVLSDGFTIENTYTGVVSTKLNFDTKCSTVIPGYGITVATDAGTGSVTLDSIGDQTHIIPGTVLGRLKEGNNAGKWKPVIEAEKSKYDCFRIASTFQETDKAKTVSSYGTEVNLSDVYTIDVVVYGQILERPCKEINLTDELKKEMPHYAWL